jgi:multicomponent Na+:H+ antiporter subunit G
MTLLVDALSLVAILAGLVFFAAGTAGLLRFPDASSRLHALTKADHLGLGLICLGLLPRAETVGGAPRLVAVWLLVMVSSAAAGPLLARLARRP